MTVAFISVMAGVATLMLAALTQASRGIFKTGKMMQTLEDMKGDIVEMKTKIELINERTYQSAIRGTQRR